MKHARPDYDRIQDPALHDPSLLSEGSSPIGEDEPVFLLRAKDVHFVNMLIRYGEYIACDGRDIDNDPMLDSVIKHISLAMDWQKKNGCKNPDMPESMKLP